MNAQRPAHKASAAGLARVEFRLLGPLEALLEGAPVELGPPKQRALLAQLLLRANEAIPVERLVDALWPEEPPSSARHAIQVYVSKLRRLLGGADRIEARSRAYLLRAEPGEIDLSRFRQLVERARDAFARDDPSGAAEQLRDALALWRARPLADLDGEPGVRELALELEEEHVAAIELRVESELQAGHSAELVPELEQLVADYPARERLHADLMLALHRAGRRADALDAYRRARESLLNELGLEPSARLQELEAAIRRRDPALTPEPPEIRARRHLPAQPNQFIGREREVEKIVELVTTGGIRLVTLTGTGGIGKTRLALAAAERLAPHFEDGVWFVDLSALSEASLVAPAVARVFGVEEAPDQPVDAALAAQLADKHLLVIVDNFEQVPEAAPSLTELLRAAPRLTLLVTSRSPLRLSEEHEYNVSPLATPSDRDDLRSLSQFEAVRLLIARARAVARGFVLSEDNAGQIAEICVALAGLPLAIELAAATLKDFRPSELRARLDTSLGLLVGGPVDAAPRQQTMHATIEWSHDLLGPDEQKLFTRLAVFSGGWTSEAAKEVCGATETGLTSLREKSLIQSDAGRYSMLTPIREFALERLTPRAVRTAALKHATYFTKLAASAKDRGQAAGPDPKILDELGREYENLRAALHWSRDSGETDLFARLAAALEEYWSVRGPHTEARQWLAAALATRPEDAHVYTRLAVALGLVCMQQTDYVQAKPAFEHAVQLAHDSGDRETEASSLGNLGSVEWQLGNHARARELLTQCQQLARELGKELTLVGAANVLGVMDLMEGRLAEAARWFEDSLLAAERIQNHEGAMIALLNLGLVALRLDRIEEAASRLRDGLRLADELQHSLQVANNVLGLAAVAARFGDHGRAGHLLGAAEAILEESGAKHEPFLSELEEETRATVRAGLGDQGASEAIATGRSERRGDALAYALEKGSDPVGV
jgi:predicted ATPase/DNA-binding SARP family transcriptional activator